MRSSHACASVYVRVLPFFPCAEDVLSRSEDINALAIIAIDPAFVRDIGGPDDDREFCGGRGLVACFFVVISSGDSDVQARSDGIIRRSVECSGLRPANGDICDGPLVRGAACCFDLGGSFQAEVLGVLGRPLNALDDSARWSSIGRTAEHLNGDNLCMLRDSELAGGDSTRAV